MGTILLVVLAAVALAAAVMLYVAFPYRGEPTPVHPVLGHVMRRGVESLPTIDVDDAERQRSPQGAHR